MKTGPYLASIALSGGFLAAWIWWFLPDISLPEGLIGIGLALVLRHIVYRGLARGRGE
jgi:hypothetical protein